MIKKKFIETKIQIEKYLQIEETKKKTRKKELKQIYKE